jgi:hypothetical protein
VTGAAYARASTIDNLQFPMGLQSFERGLERMVDGVFTRAFKGNVRPIELGRRLLREMDDNRSVDVKGRRIVPNAFAITLSADDHAGFESIEDALVAELTEAAREYARDEGYHFMGPVSVVLRVDADLKPGRFGISSQMKEPAHGQSAAALVLPSGERLPLTTQVVSFGRHPECTVVVNDGNVSRRHAEIRPSGRSFVVVDLGSTNGTKVNGIGISGEKVLNDGDIVSFGTTHVRYETS